MTQFAASIDDEDGFSDVSSICIDDRDPTYVAPASNGSRWLGRKEMKERHAQREADRRKKIDEFRKQEEDRKKAQFAALAAKDDEAETASQGESDAGSGFSDVSGDAAEAREMGVDDAALEPDCRVVDGPDIDELDGSDDEEGGDDSAALPPSALPMDKQPSISDFGSSSDESEDEAPKSPKIIRTSDDSTRIELQIQGASSGSSTGALRRVVVRLRSDWAPLGVARFMELVEAGFYHGSRVHRYVKGVLAQFGLPVDPPLHELWKSRLIADDAQDVKVENSRGTMAFATKGANMRCCQVFMNLGHNKGFDRQGFTPFAEVVQGMDVLDDLFAGYGELSPKGTGPDPELIKQRGGEYLMQFPKLSWIASAVVLSRSGDDGYGFKKRTSLKSPGRTPGSPKSSASPCSSFSTRARKVSWEDQGQDAELSFVPTPSLKIRPSSPTINNVFNPRSATRGGSFTSVPAGSGAEAVRGLKMGRQGSV